MVGFIKGMAVGLASFALGFAVLSLVLEPVTSPEAPATAPEAPTAPASESMAESNTDSLPESGTESATDSAAQTAPEAAPPPSSADTPQERVAAPDAGAPDDAVGPPVSEAPREPVAEAMADDAAEGEDDADPPTQPAPLPDTGPDSAASGTGAEVPGSSAPAMDDAPAQAAASPDPDTMRETGRPAEPEQAEAPTEPEAAADSAEPAGNAQPIEADVPGEAADPANPDAASDTEAEAAPVAPPVLRAVPESRGLDRAVEGVTIGRLPSIATSENDGETAAAQDAEGDAPTDADAQTQPARERFAAPFESAPGPLFGVVLQDAPADPAAEAAILALPMPVSVALDPHDPDAPRRARAYREAGHEVLILAVDLPQGATASDLDVTFDAWFRALPEAVALIDPVEDGFQGNRGMAQAIMPYLADDGHGLITHERGLNPAQQSANSAGVANTTVFRIIDSDDENQFTIRRYLDRATFRAQQEGRVVVMGRAGHPDTIDGLIGWRMEGRAGQVAIVPVSAILSLP